MFLSYPLAPNTGFGREHNAQFYTEMTELDFSSENVLFIFVLYSNLSPALSVFLKTIFFVCLHSSQCGLNCFINVVGMSHFNMISK